MTSPNRPRLVDIADQLDVAPSTVSRALAGSSSVSARTRERVLRVAREVGYTPNPAASGLKLGQMLNIGLIAVMNHWYAAAVTSGADRIAAESGYDFVVMSSADGDDETLLLERARRLGTRVDGALILDVSPQARLLPRLIHAVHVPVVLIGCEAEHVSSVVVDNPAIGAVAAQHLATLGHERVAILALEPPNPSAMDNGFVRAKGFTQTFSGESMLTRLPRSDRDGRQRMIRAATQGVSAVFCTSDALAIETVSLLRQDARQVPQQVAVIGVDDHPLAQPIGLTTIAQTPELMGETATRLLLRAIASAEPAERAEQHLAPTRLIIRSTT